MTRFFKLSYKVTLILWLLLGTVSCVRTQTTHLVSPLPHQSPISTNSDKNSLSNSQYHTCTPPTPEVGKAAFCGVLYSTYMDPPLIPETAFYLMHVEQDLPPVMVGPVEKKGDILGFSDKMSIVSMNDVPPGEYYLIVWAPYNWILAVVSPEDLTPRIFKFESGKTADLGKIYVPWP